jgi:enamine deaminase RidA (YjgF/YER057c/UK114 family)
MSVIKDVKEFGMPWEEQYGYAQAVKVDNTIFVSGQLSHDDKGDMVGPAPLDGMGRIVDHSNMETQMRQTYANAKKILHQFGAAWMMSSRRFFTSQIWRQRSLWRGQFGRKHTGQRSHRWQAPSW